MNTGIFARVQNDIFTKSRCLGFIGHVVKFNQMFKELLLWVWCGGGDIDGGNHTSLARVAHFKAIVWVAEGLGIMFGKRI